jgi:dipeptidyl aminopeptidase/acylaminoacyl peptidase
MDTGTKVRGETRVQRCLSHFGQNPSSPGILLTALIMLLAALPAVCSDSTDRTVNNGQLILQGVPEISPAFVARLNQFQNTRSAGFLGWTEDGKGMYIRTRFGEVPQIHHVPGPGGVRRQLTWFEDPVMQVERRDKGRELAFTRDHGGAEFDQIYLFDPITATTTLLSDGKSRNRVIRWSRDGKWLAYQSTQRDGRSNDVWLMDPADPEGARLLVKANNGDWWGPADFSEDGKYLLVQQYIKVTDSRIYLLDLKSHDMRILAGDAGHPSANRAVGFDGRDKGFYFITNSGGFAAELAWQSLQPGAETEYISSSIPWDVSEFALSDDGRRGAFVTNEGGISQLYLFNAKSRLFSRVDNMPLGVISGLEFHPDNKQLAMNLSTAQTPNDVFVMGLGRSPRDAKSLRRWTYSEVGGLDTQTFSEPELVHFPSFDMKGDEPRKIPAFVYRPDGEGQHPVIIYIHGGPEGQYRPSFSSTFQMWIAELGTAVIAPNIRGSTGYDSEFVSLDNGLQREDAVKDIGALLDWVATQPDLDENRVALYGGSYGGYMVLASAVHYSDRLKAGVDVVGISNFVTFLENTEDYRRELRRREYGDERNPEMRAFLDGISPLNNVDRIAVPMLVVQGQNDPRVPVTESEQIVAALRQRGQPVWYIKALNEGHGYDRKENQDVFQQAAILFFQRYLVN